MSCTQYVNAIRVVFASKWRDVKVLGLHSHFHMHCSVHESLHLDTWKHYSMFKCFSKFCHNRIPRNWNLSLRLRSEWLPDLLNVSCMALILSTGWLIDLLNINHLVYGNTTTELGLSSIVSCRSLCPIDLASSGRWMSHVAWSPVHGIAHANRWPAVVHSNG